MSFGDLTLVDSLIRSGVGIKPCWCDVYDNICALVYHKASSALFTVETYEVDIAGNIGDLLDSCDFSNIYGYVACMTKLSDGVIALIGPTEIVDGQDGELVTIGIDASGTINPTTLGSLLWFVTTSSQRVGSIAKLTHIDGTVWAFTHYLAQPTGSETRVATVSLSADGLTLSNVDNQSLATSSGSHYQVLHVAGTVYIATTYIAIPERVTLHTFNISNAGVISLPAIHTVIYTSIRYPIIEKLGNGWFILLYGGASGYGYIGTLHVSDLGIIDSAFTDTICYSNAVVSSIHRCFNAGTSANVSYIVIIYSRSNGYYAKSASIDIDGALGSLSGALTCISAASLYYGSAIDIYSNIFIIAGSISTGSIIRTATISVERAFDASMLVTNLIHRYDRMNRIYNLELVIGGVTSEFGMPEWTTRPVPMIKNEPDPAVVEEVKKQVNVTIPTIWGGPSGTIRELTPEDLARPGTRSDADKGNKIWQALTPWKESGGQTFKVYDEFVVNVAKKAWQTLTPWDDSPKIAKLSNKAEEVFQREFGLSSKQVQKYLNAGLTLDDIRAQFGKEKNP